MGTLMAPLKSVIAGEKNHVGNARVEKHSTWIEVVKNEPGNGHHRGSDESYMTLDLSFKS